MSKTIQRGYVLVRTGQKPSAVVQLKQAQAMQKRFGGTLLNAKGLAFTVINGFRIVQLPA